MSEGFDMTCPDEITPFEKRLVETHLSQVPFGMDADKYHRIAHEIENRKEVMPDVARQVQNFEALNAPQIRRDRWREWRPVVLLIVGLALAALALHVWPVAAAHIAEPFAGDPT